MPLPTITTARTPRLALPYLFPGQAQKEAFVNEALTRLDALVQAAVLDEIAAPPANPVAGDCYIIANAASGAWAGHASELAVWAQDQWLFAAPREGARVYDIARTCFAVFTIAEGWRRVDAPGLPSGGAVQDTEARAAIAAILRALCNTGTFSA